MRKEAACKVSKFLSCRRVLKLAEKKESLSFLLAERNKYIYTWKEAAYQNLFEEGDDNSHHVAGATAEMREDVADGERVVNLKNADFQQRLLHLGYQVLG